MLRPDYSARDQAVKHNVYASVRRRDGVSHERFATYWRDVHSTLCSRLPGLGFYVQQHFDRDGGANLWPIADGVARIDAVLDGSAELGFANAQDQAIFAEAGKILYEDEHNLFGEAIAYFLPTGSTTFVDHEEDGQRNGYTTLALNWPRLMSSKSGNFICRNRMTMRDQRHPPPVSIIPSGLTDSILPWPRSHSKMHVLPKISLPGPPSRRSYRLRQSISMP